MEKEKKKEKKKEKRRQNNRMNWSSRDVLFGIVIIGCFVGVFLGIDKYLMTLLGSIVGYFLGHKRKIIAEIKRKA